MGYGYTGKIIAYMCFPKLGITVALRPGDVIIFNPCEPHVISIGCNDKDDVLCVAMYLKTAIVGLNDNSIELSPMDDLL